MPKKSAKKNQKEDRMVDEYFKELNKYYEKFGENVILLWQCGSFFEVYGIKDTETDEMIVSKFNEFIEITHMNPANKNLTINYNNRDLPVRMAGFTAEDCYLNKFTTILVNEGYTVPVWYETGLNSKGGKDRAELHVFSPGTNFTTEKIKEETNNISCYVIMKNDKGFLNKNPSIMFGCSSIDIFTGNVKLFQHKVISQNIHNPTVFDEVERFNSIYNPSETVIIHNYDNDDKIYDIIQFSGLQTKSIHIVNETKNNENSKQALRCDEQIYQKGIIETFYKDINDYDAYLESSELSSNPLALKSFCYLLNFIFQHNPNLTQKLHKPVFDNVSNRLILGNHSLRQLNIVNTENVKGQFSSVERLINKCVTPMGRRFFRDKILHPVTDIDYLKQQYNMIDYTVKNYNKFEFLRKKLLTIKDIEHLYRKIIFNKITPIDLYNFNENLNTILDINKFLQKDTKYKKYIKSNIETKIDIVCKKLMDILTKNLNMNICKDLINNKFEINFFNKNINEVLDEVSEEFDEVEKEKQEKIKYLSDLIKTKDKKVKDPIKIHFTDKSGMYFYATDKRCTSLRLAIESNKNNTISDLKFVSGGTGGNKKIMGTTMKNFYDKFIQKQSNLKEIVKSVYTEFIISLKDYDKEMFDFVKYVSNIDILITKAFISKKYNYCKPKINEKAKKSFIIAKDIRHPLIEHVQINEKYTPNDVEIGKKFNGMLIYGTNGVGKSSINRSVGIATIMAQAGMFVPCSSFTYKPYTAIYTRILGNDNIFKGLSTFAVEMCEMATITNKSDENSLILGDEVCSGTETASAIAIFVQTLIALNKLKCSHIFATHFHQITNMDEITSLKTLTIKHMSVKCVNGILHYTRKLENGPGEDMYGLEVCKLFDFSNDFLESAHKIRRKYNKNHKSVMEQKKSKYSNNKIKGSCEFCGNEGRDIHHLEPQEFADINNYIKSIHKNHPANLTNICVKCHKKYTKEKTIHKKTKTTAGYQLIEQ